MKGIGYFVPEERVEDEDVLADLRWPIPAGVAEAYVTAYTRPADVVLVPYCQGAAAVREILAEGRRALALNFDPALVLLVEMALSPPPPRELDAAVARLGDSLKQSTPLRRYLDDLYASTCPACLRPAVADYFVWDRDQGEPVAKQLRCPACAWDGQTGLDVEDRARLADLPGRTLHYHYLLDRVTPEPPTESARARLEYLLELYSPRNLYALAELTIKVESLFAQAPIQRALKALLLDCLDRCSSLEPLPGSTAQRRGLARPRRFLERNVWRTFERAASRIQALARKPVPDLASQMVEVWAAGEEGPRSFVGQGRVRDLPDVAPPRSLGLVLSSPPALDSAVWSLAYLWNAWLFDASRAAPLRPLLRQRTPDPAWYAGGMTNSLRALGRLLRDEGRLVFVLTDQRPVMVEALVLAASDANLGIAALVQRGSDYRLELSPSLPQVLPVAELDGPLDEQVAAEAAEMVIETIQARGEPVAWRTLHAAVLRRLAESGLLARLREEGGERSPLDRMTAALQAALEHPALAVLDDEGGGRLWWLAQAAQAASPFSDRVERAAFEVLHDALALTERGFTDAVNARFPGVLTPGADLVATCLASYGHEASPGYWQLRREDLPVTRRAERETIVQSLLDLGQRLGYRTAALSPFDAAWFEGERPRAVFVVRWRAALAEALVLGDRTRGAQPYLVIPGGRAALVGHKLAHNPLWQKAVEAANWQFVKYRHVRQLVAEPEVDEYALRTIVGLDPIAEKEGAQLPLF